MASPRVLMISSEVDPFARTGGLGDAVAGLSSALAAAGADVVVVTPRYGVTRVLPHASILPSWWPGTVTARVGWGPEDVRHLGVLEVRHAPAGSGTLTTCLVDHPDLFGRDGIYGDAHGTFGDNALRFVVLSRAALEVAARVWGEPGARSRGPDIIHAHDWHAAPAIVTLQLTASEAWRSVRTVLTIHNLAFQGVLGPDALDVLALPRAAFAEGTLRHDGQVNLLAGAIALADQITTVSPTYAREIKTAAGGFGLDGLLRARAGRLVGILNGIETNLFDPAHDGAIAETYSAASAADAKRVNRGALAREMGLADDDSPMFCSVSRLTSQKGIDLLLDIVPALVHRGARVVLVGAGDGHLERALRTIADRHPGRVASRIAFDGALARRVYAGADFFVVPSRFEPCGLTQLYAMRYGALPIVSPVGGLLDTVTNIDAARDLGTGFVASAVDPYALLVSCEDAFTLFADGVGHAAAVRRAMARESSWAAPASAYLDLYQRLLA